MAKKAKVEVVDEKELSEEDTLHIEAQTQRLSTDEKFLDSVAAKIVEKLKPELATIQKFADVETRHTSFLAKEEENDAENKLDEASEKEEKEED